MGRGAAIGTHLDHYSENRGVKCAKHKTIKGQGKGGKGTKFAESPDAAAGTHKKNGDFEGIIPEDSISHLIHSLEHNVTSEFHLTTPPSLLDCGAGYMRMSEDSAGQTKRLVEANGADQKWKGFNEANGVEGDVQVHSQGKSEEEGGDR